MKIRAQIQSLIEWMTEIVVVHPWRCIAFSVCFIASLLFFLPRLQSDYGVRIWFRTTDPLIAELNALEQKFGNDESVIVAVHAKDGDLFTPARIQVLLEITDKMWTLPEVVRVDSLTNFNFSEVDGDEIITNPFLRQADLTPDMLAKKRAHALENRIINGQFLSRDGTTAIIFGQLRPDIHGSPDYRKNVDALKVLMKPYEERGDLSFHYVGASSINDAYREVSEDDIKVMMPINLLMMTFFLFFLFRTLESVVLPLGLVITTIAITFGTSALLGYKFDNLSAAIPGILIATCMADSIHLLATFYRLMKQGKERSQAVRETLLKNIMPTFLTSITTAIGFFTLTTTELLPVKNMTFLAGLGVMYAWVLSIFLLMPIVLKRPYKPFRMKETSTFSHGRSSAAVDWLYRFRYAIFTLFTLSSVVFTIIGAMNTVNSDPLKHFSKKLKVSQDSYFLLDQFNGLGGPQIVVDAGSEDGIKDPHFLRKVEALMLDIKQAPHINKITSIVDIIKELNQKLHGNDPSFFVVPDSREKIAEILLLYSMGLPQGMDLNNQVTLDNRYLRLGMMWNMHDAQRSLVEVERIYELAKKHQLNISVTGKIVLYHRMIGYIVTTFLKSMALALLFIGLIMTFSLQSWRLGLMSMLPNIMPLTFGAAVMTMIDSPIDIGTSLVLSVCLGIAVDDTIHFLNHYKERIIKDGDIKASITDVFTTTAPALIFTTIILTLCFGAFIFADFSPNVNFGILCSIILTMALFADLIYLPVILMIFKVRK